MAMIKCKECGNEVSSKAKACPNCGAEPKKGMSFLSAMFALLVIGLVLAAIGGPSDKTTNATAPKEAESTECAPNDLRCVGEKGMSVAHVYCREKIERLAKNAVKWTDEGMFERKFSRFGWRDDPGGVVRYYGDKAQFQNDFGAWVNVIYSCDVDVAAKAALSAILVGEGRMPERN